MKKIIILISVLFSTSLIFSQAPGNACPGTVLTIGACPTAGLPFSVTAQPFTGPAATCGGGQTRIAYYNFTTGAGFQNITVTMSANRNLFIQVFSGGCAGPYVVEGCSDAVGGVGGAGSGTEVVTFVASPFTNYIVQVMNSTANNMNLTAACVTSTPYVVPNDDPCTATALTVNSSCVTTNTTNLGATASVNPNPGCAGYAGGDVWYSITVPATGNVTIDTDDQVMLDGGLAVYSGPNCSTLSLVACDDNSSANGLMGMISLTGQTPGSTLWIRVWENGNDNNGAFGICAFDTPSATSQDCAGAIPVCNDASFAGNSNGFANQELNGTNEGCLLSDENQTTWFGFSPVLTGTIQLNINPTAGAVDYDFAIWGPFPPGTGCPITVNPLRCSYAAQTGTTGLQTGAGDNTEGAFPGVTPRFVNELVITPAELGQVYYLVVDNFSANFTPFTLDWVLSSPGMLDCTPPLPAELISFDGNAFTNYNQVHWATQTEINTSYFVIEKSSDAITYTEMKRANAAGFSNEIIDYNLTDENPYPVTYYRLRQVDANGNSKNYGPISINNNSLSGLSFQNIYPNPADESFKIDLYSKDALATEVFVYDSYGRMVYSKTVDVVGFNTFEIQSYDWNPGVYVVKVINAETHFMHVERMIIK